MSRLTILTSPEIKQFDKPPRFTVEQQQKYFAITAQLQGLLTKLRTPTNKVCLVLQWGYFRATGRFFQPRDFRPLDIDYVSENLDITFTAMDLNDYCQKPKISRDHEKIILRAMGFKAFNQTAKILLLEQVQHLAEKSIPPRDMLYFLASHLHQQKIEIPSYHTFTEAITQSYNRVEIALLKSITNLLTQPYKQSLEDLIKSSLTGEEILSQWKSISQSLRVRDIAQSTSIFKIIQSFFYAYWPLIKKLKLSTASIEYYAVWVKKARLSQIKQFPNRNKLYLHLLAFIQYQFYCRQDIFIDILLKLVQRIKNHAIKKSLQQEQSTRKEKQILIEQIVDEQALLEVIVLQINTIVHSQAMTDYHKVAEIKALLQQHSLGQPSIIGTDKPLSKQQQLRYLLHHTTYYDALEQLSTKLYKRVAGIIKAVDFDEETSDLAIITAIHYFKQQDGKLDESAPTGFLDRQQLKAVFDDHHQLRHHLYKVFLFFNIASAIKSGHLNLKHSYRYKAIQNYLIDQDQWQQSRATLLASAGLSHFNQVDDIVDSLKKSLDNKYQQINQHIHQGNNPYIQFDRLDGFTLSTPKVEKKKIDVISDVLLELGFIPIIQILRDVNAITQFGESFQHYSIKHHKLKPTIETLIAGIMSQGHNIGIHKICNISVGINPHTLRQVVLWFFTLKNLQSANDKIIAFINKLALTRIFEYPAYSASTASDGQKYQVTVDSLLANYSFKYFGKDKGITLYTFLDNKQSLFYSTVISASEREAVYVIDGLLHNAVIKSAIHSTDMHGFMETIFAVTHFMGTSFAPRFKQLRRQAIYGFSAKQTYAKKNYKILPSRSINSKLIKAHWDDILRFMVTIKLKEATASQLFKRLSSYAKDHPLYRSLKEFGRIIKSLFILTYLDEVELRQQIEKQLNRVELSNKFAKAIFFDKGQVFQVATHEEQETAAACKMLIQNAIVLWNYLYLSQRLVKAASVQEKITLLETIKQGSVLSWQHVNMQGEYDFTKSAPANFFDIQNIMTLKIDSELALNSQR